MIFNTKTPVPWCNILTNERFGTVISSYGTVYSFYKNSSEYKLTNWSNDFANFIEGETFTGIFENHYNLKYGFGYVNVSEENEDILKTMDIFVPIDDDLKIHNIVVTNNSLENKTINITYKLDLVLGVAKELTNTHILCRGKDNRLEFKNSYSEHFSDVVSYLKVVSENDNIDISYDEENYKVSINILLSANEKTEFSILFGSTTNEETINKVISKYSTNEAIVKEYENTKKYWETKVVRNFNTGNEYLDIMANGWLLYQTIASRLFARTGFYQAGGAFGFRDQLQDTLALIRMWPERTKKQIIKHASKQFEKGDVLHWWHEHNSAGIKTYFSDDYLWLPYVTAEYVIISKDKSILTEKAPFLKDREMNDNREIYDIFEQTEEQYTIYQHCIRAIKYGLSRKGMNGLLDIGDGDWNDGFSSIRGQSVWLTFFMMDLLDKFIKIANIFEDEVTKMHFQSEKHILKQAILTSAYAGEYFARAFFENGEPLGTPDSSDCKIDLISQAWAAIALKDYPDCQEKIKSSLASAEKFLVDRENMIVKLLHPPFDKPKNNPGYIKSYVPGVRENGGQYTHAAIWLAKAYFEINEKEKAMSILNILNPILHSNNKKIADIYKVEPFVVAADVYSNVDHVGRGGWTWYTGSSAWMYKVIEDVFDQESK
ncbi:MAG: hypothetical protein PHR25_03060 [Clostridia bacterium]|nr:hypothetical protein [Clostridia bacterium]MDD4375740.1 hypothetical protein [Clostridia bacterium]